jgi:predicted SAM-dependent methyltransferase
VLLVKPWAVARHPRRWLHERTRRRLAARVIKGTGIEIGALHNPFPVPEAARVSYVDRLGTSELRDEYPELADRPLVEVDVVDDGETLAKFEEASLDFVIASHFLEHCEDPVGALKAHLRVLRPGGVLLLAVPDRRHGVDRGREPTSLEHVLADHEQGPLRSRAEHYRDWVRLVDEPLGNVQAGEVEERAAELQHRGYSIHFHCWTRDELAAQLRDIIRRFGLPGAPVEQSDNYHEFLLAVRRT